MTPEFASLHKVIFIAFASCSGTNVKIGVPENYDGIFPWYLAKVWVLLLLKSFSIELFCICFLDTQSNRYMCWY